MSGMLFQRCSTSMYLDDLQLRDSLCTQLDRILIAIEEALQVISGQPLYHEDVETLLHLQLRARRYHQTFLSSINTCSVASQAVTSPHQLYTGNAGRPKLIVNVEQVELLRTAGYTWEEVSCVLNVSRTTLWRRFHELGLPLQKYSEINDRCLDHLVRSIQQNNPNIGVNMLQGYLKSQGVNVQRRRVRESILRIKPLRAIVRWQQTISRRTYSVPGPNSLWHIDSHHSLIRWRFIVHGCVDGFSRMIPYLACASDNMAETVLKLFRNATSEFGVPSRVRSDKGGENILVCHFTVSYRGPGRSSHIAGSSVHNQRIERMWRDVYRCVACSFHEVFYFLEAQELLDPDDEYDLFVLHSVFLCIIDHHLQMFRKAWNQHPMRTERNWSPHKIWLNGMIDPERQHLTAVRDVVDDIPQQVIEEFGIDDEGPYPDEQLHTMSVPEIPCPLPNSMMYSFMHGNDNFDIHEAVSEYIQRRHYLIELLSEESFT